MLEITRLLFRCWVTSLAPCSISRFTISAPTSSLQSLVRYWLREDPNIEVISKLWHIEKKSSRRLTDQMDKHFISRWFYFKLLCDCFRYVLKRLEIISLKTKCRKHIFKLIQNTWKYRWNETNNFYLSLHNFSELRNLFSRVPMGNCFCCYFMQLFISLASRKCKRTVLYLKLFWYKFFVQ